MASNDDQLQSDKPDRELMIYTSVNLLNSNGRQKRMINDLPPELMPLAFEHLDLLDLPNCRLVSKLWRFYIDRVKITELIVKNVCSRQPGLWFVDMKPLNLRNIIKGMDFLHRFPFELANVRRFKLQHIGKKHEFKILKLFPNVQHLEIDALHSDEEVVYTLDLPELKKLYVNNIFFSRLTINSRIEALSSPHLCKIHCVHPLEIKFLQLEDWHGEETSIYKNVECLSITYFYALTDLIAEEWFLKVSKNLKIIKCYSYHWPKLLRWKDPIDRLTVLRSELGKEGSLKIYFDDTELIGTKRFEEYGFRGYTPLNLTTVNQI